jgi:hypothetical protein
VCESIQDYLLKRLSTDSAAVKLKTLRVTKCSRACNYATNFTDLIDKGNRHFKRDLTRRIDVLRDAACTHVSFCASHPAAYRGPPDPLRGDAPYRLVREEAQVLTDLRCLMIVYSYCADGD